MKSNALKDDQSGARQIEQAVIRRIFYRLIAIAALLFFAWCVFISIMSMQSDVVNAQFSHSVTGAVFIAPTTTATVSSSPSNGGGFDPTIIAAIIGACIAGNFGILGIIYGARLQRRIVRCGPSYRSASLLAQGGDYTPF